jgi:PLP dependent protein
MSKSVIEQYQSVSQRIADACRTCGRDQAAAQLVVVSKTFPTEAIIPVLDAGHRVFGENRVQETQQKWPALRDRFAGIELHLIGPLQSNKAAEAVRFFDVIETIDRPKIAAAVASEASKQGRPVRCYLQVNTGDESQKAGVSLSDAGRFIEDTKQLLTVDGLMCIPPVNDSPAKHFRLLAGLARDHSLPKLSMGMSHDFEVAIAEGATHVRVGSAIFGSRSVTK